MNLSTPTRKVLDAMPGAMPELIQRTGYPMHVILGEIVKARIAGVRVTAKSDLGVTVFALDTQLELVENGTHE